MEAAIPTTDSNDVFSISDQALSDRLHFVQEIGFGNWGSVWLCRPKLSSSTSAKGQKLAVKLVHRSKTSTTAARVRSLWNEMKIVRQFKNDTHPAIIHFHSFVLTPSYALITMTYLPSLVPVEVEEAKAREWFRFLLSGVDFLHRRGVVHNDIKPANILLSHKSIPVLVDFGFAEKYDIDSPKAFHSNLSYGTPEYLSPERARGLPHDTRKSDIWSLGITFFEILSGRTPFEETDGEQLSTKEDLEKYWHRTLRGNWIGEWKMSTGLEKLLQRMISPNADLRCTASQAIADEFWRPRRESLNSHRRSSSYTSSVVFEKDSAKLIDRTPTSTRSGRDKFISPPGLESPLASRSDISSRQSTNSKSQFKVAVKAVASRKRPPQIPPIPDLSPIKASPPATPFASASRKENTRSTPKGGTPVTGRKALGVLSARNENLPRNVVKSPLNEAQKKGRALSGVPDKGDLSRRNSQEVKGASRTAASKGQGKESTSVRDRVRDWEKERQRLREMARLEESDKETDEEIEKEEKVKKHKHSIKKVEVNKENHHNSTAFHTSVPPSPAITPPLTQATNKMSFETPTRPSSSQGKKFGHAIRASIDRTLHAYKSSAFASGRSTPARSLDIDIKDIKPEIDSLRARGSCQTPSWTSEVDSSLPVVRNAKRTEKVAADSRMDRLTIWMQNVEKVVEDARQGFAASAKVEAPLQSLPAAPRKGSYIPSTRSSRLPRKVLAASEIFAECNDDLKVDIYSANESVVCTPESTSSRETPPTLTTGPSSLSISSPLMSAPPSQNQLVIPEIHTPSRKRRATVSENSPIAIHRDSEMSPSKRREKSRSHGNLLQQRIASLTQLEAEFNKPTPRGPTPRLSEMFDQSIFIAAPLRSYEDCESTDPSSDELNASPYHIKPYPQRELGAQDALPDTPQQRHMEGVYDRYLMAASGVKRVGKGYQSDYIPPPPNSANSTGSFNLQRRQSRALFGGSKTHMPPPVSSEDVKRSASVDEMGFISPDMGKEESYHKVSFMKKAIKAIVPSTKHSKRPSKIVVT